MGMDDRALAVGSLLALAAGSVTPPAGVSTPQPAVRRVRAWHTVARVLTRLRSASLRQLALSAQQRVRLRLQLQIRVRARTASLSSPWFLAS